MSRLDRMRKGFKANASVDAAKPINPNAEKILEDMLDKAIPMMAYCDGTDIERAIFEDALDEGLIATEIHDAIEKLTEFDKYQNYKCMSILLGVDKFAKAFIILGMHPRVESIDAHFERSVNEEKQDEEGRKYNHEQTR